MGRGGRMLLSNRWVSVALWACAGVFLIFFFRDSLWSVSGDMSAHDFIVNRLIDHWEMSPADEERLCGVTYYPRLAHTAAAVFGTVTGSAIEGMHFASLVSLIGLWTGFSLILRSLPTRSFVPVGVALLSLLVLNRLFVGLELHGHEIIHNYFLPQLAGQAFVVLMLTAAAMFEQRGGDVRISYAVLGASAVIAANFHVVPALVLLGMLALLVAIDFLVSRRSDILGIGAIATLAGAAGAVAQPGFRYLAGARAQVGGLPLKWTPDVPSLAILCTVVAAVSAVLLVRWLRGSRESMRSEIATKCAAVYGLANSLLCLFQICLVQLGWSAEYAARKYAFGINTSLLLELALLLGMALRWRQADGGGYRVAHAALRSTFVSLVVMASFFLVVPNKKEFSVTRLADMERFARSYTREAPPNAPGTFNFAVGLKPTTINVLISLGALEAPSSDNLYLAPTQGSFPDPFEVAHILTEPGAKPWDVEVCRTPFASASLVVLDGPCIVAALGARPSLSTQSDVANRVSWKDIKCIDGRIIVLERAAVEKLRAVP
jgi:hypothetical protein